MAMGEPPRNGRRQDARVVVVKVDDLEIGHGFDRLAQRAERVAPVVAEEAVVRAEEPGERRHRDEDVAAGRDVFRRLAQHGAIVGCVFEHIHQQREIDLRVARPRGLDASASARGGRGRGVGGVDAEELLRLGVAGLLEEGEEEPEPAADVGYAASRAECASVADSLEEEIELGPIVPMTKGLVGSEVGAFNDVHVRRRREILSRA